MGFTVRETFKLTQRIEKWFPGHMYRGLKDMQNLLPQVDCFVEVHDARIPFSGRNTDFRSMLTAIKPHILVLNKVDLIDPRYKHAITEKIKAQRQVNHVIFSDCSGYKQKEGLGYDEVLPNAVRLIKSTERYNRSEEMDYNIMIIGIPNCGKSSLINRLRNKYLGIGGRPARIGAMAGVTRSVQNRIKISNSPSIYLFDTPGVVEPKSNAGLEALLRAALCGM